jgi:hypothetical protein
MSNIFYEGQQVGCLIFGEGRVAEITETSKYPIRVEFKIEIFSTVYTNEGKYTGNSRPTLYPIEQYRAIIANLPAPQPEKWQPKPGEWCWFWIGISFVVIDQFAEFSMPSGIYKTKTGGWYRNCAPFTGELPEHLKEVQP